MNNPSSQAQNHPKEGSTIKVKPIRDLKAIQRIKKILVDKPRDVCLFTLGINTAYRANELLSIKVRDVAHLQVGDGLEIKQSKVDKYRKVTLNQKVIEAITALLVSHDYQAEDHLFYFSAGTGIDGRDGQPPGEAMVQGCRAER